MYVCGTVAAKGYWIKKKVPNKSHPIQPVKCSRCSNLVCCSTLCAHWQWQRTTHEMRSFSLFVSPISLSNIRSETGITIIHFSKWHLDGLLVPFLVLMCFSSKLKTFSVHTIPYYLSLYLYSILLFLFFIYLFFRFGFGF